MHAFLLALLISTQAIRGHVQFLASDLLEGRGTGARGHAIAAEYVATQFEAMGVEPGAEGSWFQEVPFLKTTAGADSTITLTRAGAEPVVLKFAEDFITTGDPLSDEKSLEAEMVFAGFGVTAPDQKHDDYAGLETRSKIVVILSGAPKTFPNAVRAHYSSTQNKIETAARHGAAGLVIVNTPTDALRFPWDRVVRQSKLGSMHWLDPRGVPHGVVRNVSFTTTLSQSAATTVLGGDIEKAQRGPLPWRAKILLDSTRERLKSPNVVGLVRGSDPKLRDEYVVYTSHLDHLGISDPVNGDAINNGAFDNASGIAAILEIARAFATNPRKPRRSILFVATTAEEKGLRGADYFANNPTVPFESLVANINIDQILMLRPVRTVIVHGADTNDLGDIAREVAAELKIAVLADPSPEEVVFVRSDQYPFIKRGIPAIFPTAGYVDADPEVANVASAWRRTRYHTPQDDLTQPIEWSVATMLAELGYGVGRAVAERDARPMWKPGDFFGETFGRK